MWLYMLKDFQNTLDFIVLPLVLRPEAVIKGAQRLFHKDLHDREKLKTI